MIHAYDKVYLDKARTVLGRMLDFAVYDLQYDLTEFWNLFLTSDVASRFESGDFNVLVGKSGVELGFEVLECAGISAERIKPKYSIERSEEYWTGWALAYYQWDKAIPFAEITKYIPIEQVKALYNPYHEMDIRQFCDEMNRLYEVAKPDTNLKLLRTAAGLSQQALADASDISVRTIQQYEQCQKNINKANAEYLVSLARVLECNMTDLMELDGETD